MAANSNMSYYHGAIAASAFNRHAFALQTEAVSSSTGIVPISSYSSYSSFGNLAGTTVPDGNCGAAGNAAGSVVPGSSPSGGFLLESGLRHENCVVASSTAGSIVPGSNSTGGFILDSGLKHENCVAASDTAGSIVPGSNSTGGFLLDSGLKHDTGLALDWSAEEQLILEEGLEKYAEESSIMRYIKVAALLRDKTVRDVALRCRWMTKKDSGKRRMPEEHSMGKKLKDGKEKLMDSLPKTNMLSSIQPSMLSSMQLNMPAYSLVMQQTNYNDQSSYGVSAIAGVTRHLLDENAQTFGQIVANLGACKIQDNIDLLCRTKNNLLAILNDMRATPGIMSRMPPLPVSIDEELASTILPSAAQAGSQAFTCWDSSGIQLKPEPQF